jgi:hypothetical protein
MNGSSIRFRYTIVCVFVVDDRFEALIPNVEAFPISLLFDHCGMGKLTI